MYKFLNFENKLFSWLAYYRDLFPLPQFSPHITPLQLHAMWLIFRSKWSKKILWLGLSPPVDFTGECNLVNCVKILCCFWNWIALVLRIFLKMLIQICSYYWNSFAHNLEYQIIIGTFIWWLSLQKSYTWTIEQHFVSSL